MNLKPYISADLNGRMGDLLAALGEIERVEGNHKVAVKHMRYTIPNPEP